MKITKDNWFQELLNYMKRMETMQEGNRQIIWCRSGCGICYGIRHSLLLTICRSFSEKDISIEFIYGNKIPSIHSLHDDHYRNFEELPTAHQEEVLSLIYRGLRNLTKENFTDFKDYLISYFVMINDWTDNREELHRQLKDSPANEFLKEMEEYSGDYGIKN